MQTIEQVKGIYQGLLRKYAEEGEQIENIDELFTKFRNLKLYEMEFDKHEELKKELQFWNNPNYHQKSPQELALEHELHQVIAINAQLKAQLNSNY